MKGREAIVEFPLHDQLVVEASELEGVQYAGRVLASLGAEVIKVETEIGDEMRRRPPFAYSDLGLETSVPFEFLNAGKKSVVLSASHPSERKVLKKLLHSASVILTDCDSGVSRMSSTSGGLDDPVVLVAGPFGARPVEPAPTTAFTRLHSSTSGYLLPADKNPAFRPAASGPLVFEAMHGTSMAVAVMSELLRGHGGEIDYSYQAYGVWLDKMNFHQTSSGDELHRMDHAYPFGGNLECTDGYVCIFVIEEHQWQNLCRMVSQPEWIDDPRYADGRLRRQNQAELDEYLSAWCRSHSVEEVLVLARAHDVPAGMVRSPRHLLSWDVLETRGFYQKAETAFGQFAMPGLPFGGEHADTSWEGRRALVSTIPSSIDSMVQ